ncbi:hypothetical protein CCM_07559 [Cordyceps militaris CM01]|uniref:Uncharacterized protein n=1 Tax=Cordyceps militaris (strain CM01) TaxID=983644 RepID=G3JQ57_CORMM|nr:uncharacterized protein CCM_07559 [Cordyceps militaris CM01]EGX89308.1 hypothetical protein CCM_07559 [Cordyceps militaris CM01]
MGRLTRPQRIVIYVEMAVRALAIIMLALALGIFIYTSVSWDYNILHGYIIVRARLYLMSRMALEAAAAGGAIGGGVVVFSEPSSPPDCESPTCQAALQIGVAREPAATLIWIAA